MAGKVVYEYTDAQGGTHRVDSISQVPKDRLKFMVASGEDETAGAEGGTASTAAAPAAAKAPQEIAPQVYGVCGALLIFGMFMTKNFLLRVLAIATAVLYFFYAGYDVFMGSKYARTSERDPKHHSARSGW